jgi:hypothetical protein
MVFYFQTEYNSPTKNLEYAGSTLLSNFGQFIPGYRPAQQNTAIFIATGMQT